VPKPPPLDPSIIDKAPLEDNQPVELGADNTDLLYNMLYKLQMELEETKSENEKLKGSKTFNQVKAEMLKPYADAVFRFVMGYCAVVGVLVLMAGYETRTGFKLPETILGIISGSTAVSVIGLIGMVISGLFGATKEYSDK